jgi:hypothetical protein
MRGDGGRARWGEQKIVWQPATGFTKQSEVKKI